MTWRQDWQSRPLGEVIAERVRQTVARWISAKPDPWSKEVDDAIRGPDAVPVCHRCFASQENARWFCPECGTATGTYNNLMPYIWTFSLGEVARSGVHPTARFTPARTAGYVAFGIWQYQILAPVYFVCLYLNHRRQKRANTQLPNPEP